MPAISIRNVGRAAMEHLVEMREAGGQFADLFDFIARIDPRQINKRALESLARAGALDSLHPNRGQIVAGADQLIGYAQSLAADRAAAQESLFGDAREGARPHLPKTETWNPIDRLDEELTAVGFYLSGHPLEDMVGVLRRQRVTLFQDALSNALSDGGEGFRMAGVVRRKQERSSSGPSGGKFAFVTLSDPTGEYEVLFMPESLRAHRELLEPGKAIVFKARAEATEGEVRFYGDDRSSLERVVEQGAAGSTPFAPIWRNLR